jgi:hypothetical protein
MNHATEGEKGMDPQSSVEVDLKNQTAKITGNDVATVLTALMMVGVLMVLYLHHTDAKEGRAEFIAVMKEQASATKDQTSAQREQNCLLVHRNRFKADEAHELTAFCKSLR